MLDKLAPGWTGTFADLVVTAAELADPTADEALIFEIVLDRLLRQRREDRFFGGAAMDRADWPVRRALGDAQSALGRWREARTGCAGCGRAGLRWASSSSMGIGPTFFLEHWCADCVTRTGGVVATGDPDRPRVVPRPDFAALRGEERAQTAHFKQASCARQSLAR